MQPWTASDSLASAAAMRFQNECANKRSAQTEKTPAELGGLLARHQYLNTQVKHFRSPVSLKISYL